MKEIRFEKRMHGWFPATDHDADLLGKHKIGTIIAAKISQPRSGRQHRYMWALVSLVADNQDFYPDKGAVMTELKLKCGLYDTHINRYRIGDEVLTRKVHIPKSIAFDRMDGGEFSTFVDKAINVICTEIIPGMDSDELRMEVENFIAGGQNHV